MKCDLFIDILQKLKGKYSTVLHTAMLNNQCWEVAFHVTESQLGAAVSIMHISIDLTKSSKLRGYDTPDYFCAYFVHCLKIYNIDVSKICIS